MKKLLMLLVASFVMLVSGGVLLINTAKPAHCAMCVNPGAPCVSNANCPGVGCRCIGSAGRKACAPTG